jgi:hypothetical protein
VAWIRTAAAAVRPRILASYIAKDTVDAGQFILQTLGADLVQYTERTDVNPHSFFQHNRIWITDRKTIENHVLNRLNDCYDVFFRQGTELFSHTRNMRQSMDLLKYIKMTNPRCQKVHREVDEGLEHRDAMLQMRIKTARNRCFGTPIRPISGHSHGFGGWWPSGSLRDPEVGGTFDCRAGHVVRHAIDDS